MSTIFDPLASAATAAASFTPTGDAAQDAQMRAKIRAGLDPAMAAMVVAKENAERGYLKMSDRDGMIGLLLKIKPLRAELARLEVRSWRTADEDHRAEVIKQEFQPLLAVAAELADRIFQPMLETKRAEAREQVKAIAGGSEDRIVALIENHWEVVRFREFLRYVDGLGNSELKRSDFFIEFFEAQIKAGDQPAHDDRDSLNLPQLHQFHCGVVSVSELHHSRFAGAARWPRREWTDSAGLAYLRAGEFLPRHRARPGQHPTRMKAPLIFLNVTDTRFTRQRLAAAPGRKDRAEGDANPIRSGGPPGAEGPPVAKPPR